MTVTVQAPQELGYASYVANGTVTGASAAAADGIALSTAWGFSFTTNARAIEVECFASFVTTATAGGWAEVHVMVDNVCRFKLFRNTPVATLDGGPEYGKARITGLSAGSHTVAVWCKVNASTTTGTVQGTSDSPGYLRVYEV